ncbi:MAG: hypothetical protein FRX48_01286 [Lasallia pustulata]|uniref:DNA-directed RNA polymerase III subunit RPC9 n=1 Tax=Lasallia pustulata TaxID=136370 RepID=A0A5M8PYK0_9LECA|nr:MAG: hypothetical protein FRX48_01286 [Lasallia pustulata]
MMLQNYAALFTLYSERGSSLPSQVKYIKLSLQGIRDFLRAHQPPPPTAMKIVATQSATLSNYEVLTHLTSTRAKSSLRHSADPRSSPMKSPNLETVTKELTDYLSPRRPPPPIPTPAPPYASAYTPSTIKILLTSLRAYDLTKAELLMILNLRPADMGLLDCVVEECDMRFSAEEQEEILRVGGRNKRYGGGILVIEEWVSGLLLKRGVCDRGAEDNPDSLDCIYRYGYRRMYPRCTARQSAWVFPDD